VPGASGGGNQLENSPADGFLYSSLLNGQPSTKRARVEIEDPPFKINTVAVEFDPPAGEARARPAGMSKDFERLQESQRSSGDQPWAPFSSIQDWELARYIMSSGLSQRKVDALLALDAVSNSLNHRQKMRAAAHKISAKAFRPVLSQQSWPAKED